MFQTKNNKEAESALKDDDFEDMISWGSPLSNSSNLSQGTANASSTLDFLDDEDECINSQQDRKINFAFMQKTNEEKRPENSKEAKNEKMHLNEHDSKSLFDSDEDYGAPNKVETQVCHRQENGADISTKLDEKNQSSQNSTKYLTDKKDPVPADVLSETKMDKTSHSVCSKSSLTDLFSQSSNEDDLLFESQTLPETVQNSSRLGFSDRSDTQASLEEIDENYKAESSVSSSINSTENAEMDKKTSLHSPYSLESQGSSISTSNLNFSSFTSNSIRFETDSSRRPPEEKDIDKNNSENVKTDSADNSISEVEAGQNYNCLNEALLSEDNFQEAFERSNVYKVLSIDNLNDLSALNFLGISDEDLFDSCIDAEIDGSLLNKALLEGYSFPDTLLSSLTLPDSLSGDLIRYKLGLLSADKISFRSNNFYQILQTHDKNLFRAFVSSQEDKILFFTIFYKMGLLDFEDVRDELDLNSFYHQHVLYKLGILHEGEDVNKDFGSQHDQVEFLSLEDSLADTNEHLDNQDNYEPNNKDYTALFNAHESASSDVIEDLTTANDEGHDASNKHRSRPLFEDSDGSSDLFPEIDKKHDKDTGNASQNLEDSSFLQHSDKSNDKECLDNDYKNESPTTYSFDDETKGISNLSIKPNEITNAESTGEEDNKIERHSSNLVTDDTQPSYSLITNVGSNEKETLEPSNNEIRNSDEHETSSNVSMNFHKEEIGNEQKSEVVDEHAKAEEEPADSPLEEQSIKSSDSALLEDENPDKTIYHSESNSKSSSDLKSDSSSLYKNKFSKSFADIFTLEGDASENISSDVSSYIADTTENDKPLLSLSEAEEKSSVISSIFRIFKKKPVESPQPKNDPYLNRFSRPKTAELKIPEKERKVVHKPYANKKQADSFEIPGFKKVNK